MNTTGPGLACFVLDNSLLLLAGTATAVMWANLDVGSYDRVAHPVHFAVNDIGMVFFFALAAKKVFEATLPGGALASPRRAFSPLAAAMGGMVVPALIYLGLTWARGPADLARGTVSRLLGVGANWAARRGCGAQACRMSMAAADSQHTTSLASVQPASRVPPRPVDLLSSRALRHEFRAGADPWLLMYRVLRLRPM